MSTDPATPVKTNHPTGFWFFFWGEFAERCSFYGMRAILPLYLSDELGFGDARGGMFYFIFLASCYLLPLLGGLIADNYLGKYWTIVGFSIPYVAGQFLIGFSKDDHWLLILSLCLLAMGTGVIKPNISTLMGMTYDQQRPGQLGLRSAAFSYFYMAINIGAFLSQASLPALRDAYGYTIAFMVPGVLMVIALIIFAMGKPYYAAEAVRQQKASTPEERALKWKTLRELASLFLMVVFFWAVFDQSSETWVKFARDYMNRETGLVDLGFFRLREIPPDGIQTLNPLFIVLLTPIMVILWGRLEKKGYRIRPTQKMFVGFLLTASTMGIMTFAAFLVGEKQAVYSITTSEGTILVPMGKVSIQGAGKTETKDEVTTTEFQGASVSFSDSISITMTKGQQSLPEKAEATDPPKLTFSDGVLTLPKGKLVFESGRINFDKSKALFPEGLISLDGVIQSRFKNGSYILNDSLLKIDTWEVKYLPKPTPKPEDEAKRIAADAKKPPTVVITKADYVPPEQRCSVLWMAIAFFVITVAELLISVVGLELAFTAAPATMKGFVTGNWLLTVFVANIFINVPVSQFYPHMNPAHYFLMFTVFGFIISGLFLLIGRRFDRVMAEKEKANI